jgi:MFS family permease
MSQKSIEGKDDSVFKWVIVGVGFTTLALSYTVMYSFSVFFVALLKEFDWNRSTAAGAFSVFWILHGLIGPFVGALVDRFGSRKVFILGASFLGTGLGLCSLIHSWWQLYVFFSVITGIGVGSTGWVPNSTVILGWFKEKRGWAMGLISSGIGIGIFVCIPIIQRLITSIGWRTTYRVMAVFVPLIIIAMAIVFLRKQPQAGPAERKPSQPLKTGPVIVDSQWASRSWSLREAIHTHQFRALCIAFFSSSLFIQSVMTHHVAFFVDEGLAPLAASYIVGMIGIVSIAGKLFWAVLSDRIGREITFTLVGACSILGLLCLIVFSTLSSPHVPYLYALFFGLGYAGAASLPPLITADFFEGKAYGAIFGTLFVLNGVGGAFGAWFAGFLHDQMRSYTLFFVIAMGCAFLSCLCVWISAPRRVRAVPGKAVKGLSPEIR